MTENWGKALIKTGANSNAKVASSLVPAHLKQPILNVGATINKIGITANTKIKGLGNTAQPQTIGWLFDVLRMSASKFRKKKSAQVKPTQTTQVKHDKKNNKLENLMMSMQRLIMRMPVKIVKVERHTLLHSRWVLNF